MIKLENVCLSDRSRWCESDTKRVCEFKIERVCVIVQDHEGVSVLNQESGAR